MDMSSIMQQAQQMHQKMKKIQEDLAAKSITGSAGGGMVQAVVNGQGDVLSISIEPVLLCVEEKTMLQDLLTAALNDALRKAREVGKQEMSNLTGGLNIPGLNNLF